TIAQSLTIDRSPDGYILEIDYDADEFLKLSSDEQNNILFSQHGYAEDPETLRNDFNTLIEAEIVKERIKIQQCSDKIDEIEDTINKADETFDDGVVNVSPIYVGDTVEFFSKYFGNDVTPQTTFYVNSNHLGAAGVNTFVPTEAGTFNGSCIYQYNSRYYTFEVLPTP